ncbi:MAG: hypothetical protein V1873_01910 [Verrucomicrobiota bacterium]
MPEEQTHGLGLIGSVILALAPRIRVEEHALFGGTVLWTLDPFCALFLSAVGVLSFYFWFTGRERIAGPLCLLAFGGFAWAIFSYHAAAHRVLGLANASDRFVASFAKIADQGAEWGRGWITLSVGLLLLLAEVVRSAIRRRNE